jgi:hydrogenase nickel incorporation protein HypA/HybF
MKGYILHELSIVTYVVNQVEKIAKENDLTKVSSVTLEFGEVSGIVPAYLVDCWDWCAKKEALIEGARLICETIPAVTWCDDCKKTYPTVAHGKTCPYCGSGNTWLQQGTEVTIKEIEAM